MKRNYIIPRTEKVNFGAEDVTMSFTNLTNASNPSGPGSSPIRRLLEFVH